MPGFKSRLRIINTFLIISLLMFAVVILVIVMNDNEGIIPYQSNLLKNIVKMQKVDLLYVVDNDTYVKLKSESGNVNIIDYNIDLINLDLIYTSKNFLIDMQAEKGEYFSQRFVKAYDNITGHMDNMTLKTGQNGVLEYDYVESKGIVKNDVMVYQDNNSISSQIIEFDIKSNFITFKDNVTAYYVPVQK